MKWIVETFISIVEFGFCRQVIGKVSPTSTDYISDLGIECLAFLISREENLSVERTLGLRPENEGPEDEEKPGDQGQQDFQSE